MVAGFDLSAYLARIGLPRPPAPDAAGLAALQAAQLAAIAFEDITAFLGRVPDLDPAAVWRRLVADRLGGWCFELNGLFGRALAALGFRARPIMCRVRGPDGRAGARTHLAWIVTIDSEDWLADTGFGGPGAPVPLPVRAGRETATALGRYRIATDPATGETTLARAGGDGWVTLYGWDDAPVTAADIRAANFLCARWDGAPFPGTLMVARLTASGRASLRNRVLRLVDGGAERVVTLDSAGELHDALGGVFGLAVDATTARALWARLGEMSAAAAPPLPPGGQATYPSAHAT